ncbi:MAG: RNA 2',3'-cyclic phosphodiesterase [Bacteroidota bacterium]|nr:RNA 2',3'-cyclic phosphodiesterase [Bacteroidota bacterium]
MKRLFVAISLPVSKENRERFFDMQNSFRGDKIKWIDIDNAHLTLKFFGNTREDNIKNICEMLDEATAVSKSFVLEVSRLGVFGSKYKPRVIWIGFENSEELLFLENQIHIELQKIGFENDRQNFVPHLTMGRINSIWDKNDFQNAMDRYRETFSQKIEVNEISLIESVLTPKGPIYKIIKSFRLSGN